MTNLVKRLRKGADYEHDTVVMEEAADRIEKLELRSEQWKATATTIENERLVMKDRIEKLEAALKPFADLAYESDGEMVVLPIYDIYTDEWLIQLEDASFKRISHEEYKKLYVFKTRYDVGR